MTTISEKVAHVKSAPNTDGRHECHWPGCGTRVKPAMWGCTKHWFMLPKAIRNRIWAAYNVGQEETKTPTRAYIAAAQEAQKWIAENAK